MPAAKNLYSTLCGDKVSMLTYNDPHKSLRKYNVAICNHQAGSPLLIYKCSLMSDQVICKHKNEYVSETECPFWDQVSLTMQTYTDFSSLWYLIIFIHYSEAVRSETRLMFRPIFHAFIEQWWTYDVH